MCAMKIKIDKKMIFLPFILIVLGIAVVLFTMAVPRREGDWEIDTHRITESPGHSWSPSLVFVGSEDTEYAVAWQDNRSGTNSIYFAKIDASGNKIGRDVPVLDSREGFFPHLIWTGAEYGMSYFKLTPNPTTCFQRLDINGDRVGNEIILATNSAGSFHYSSLVWTGTEYGVAFSRGNADENNDLCLTRLDSLGNMIGETIIVSPTYGYNPSLVWTGNGYAVTWYGQQNIYFSKIDIDSEGVVNVGDNIVIESSDNIIGFPFLVWTGTEYGLVWSSSLSGGPRIYITRLDNGGNIISRLDTGVNGFNPRLVWTGTKYGIAYKRQPESNFEILFASINADGPRTGGVIITTINRPYSNPHYSFIWTGSEYGIAWNATNTITLNDEIYFATIRDVGEEISITGSQPSIYRNIVVTEVNRWDDGEGTEIFIHDLYNAIVTRIPGDEYEQRYPMVHGDIVVYQHNDILYREEDTAFNYFGLVNNCYATVYGDQDWDVYMYRIGGEEGPVLVPDELSEPIDSIQQTKPRVYGDYIIWEERPRYSRGAPSYSDIGIYNISSGETTYLSARVGDPSRSYSYTWAEIYGNIITYCKSIPDDRAADGYNTDVYIYNLVTNLEERITTEITDQRPYAFNGEWLVYIEVIPEYDRRGDTLAEYGAYLKAYNLVTRERIDIVDEPKRFQEPNGNPISGTKLIFNDYVLGDYDSQRTLKLYDFVTRRIETVSTMPDIMPIFGFDIWGNRIVCSNGDTISVILLPGNTPSGRNIETELSNVISVKFGTVEYPGETVLESGTADAFGGGHEGAFRLVGGSNTFYNIDTSAVYSGDIYITFNYGEMSISDRDADRLNLYHWDETIEPAAWAELERTEINTMTNTVTFVTDSLSPFWLGFPPNNPPQIEPIPPKTVRINNLLRFTVLAIDPDGDTLVYSAVGLPAGARFNRPNRVFSWIPTSRQVGTYNITFNVSDGELTDTETLRITVLPAVKTLR